MSNGREIPTNLEGSSVSPNRRGNDIVRSMASEYEQRQEQRRQQLQQLREAARRSWPPSGQRAPRIMSLSEYCQAISSGRVDDRDIIAPQEMESRPDLERKIFMLERFDTSRNDYINEQEWIARANLSNIHNRLKNEMSKYVRSFNILKHYQGRVEGYTHEHAFAAIHDFSSATFTLYNAIHHI